MGKYLSGLPGRAVPYGTAALLTLMPYNKPASDHYGLIMYRNSDKKPSVISCQTKINSRQLADELSEWYLPGGVNIEYVEQLNGDWLVCFKAQSILASAYMRLSSAEMNTLLNRSGLLG